MPEEINVRVSDVSGMDSKIVLSGVPRLNTLPGLEATVAVDFFRRRDNPKQDLALVTTLYTTVIIY
uniref:Kinesin motor domain-containing protein n=1 Tax=Heterorhabditis bacteriophora TaxID=37862 RepID=A0A1I7WUD2_HETBA